MVDGLVTSDTDTILTAWKKHVPFSEVCGVLESGKSAGHDKFQPVHLKYGGEALNIWIQQICNAIVELESVPDSLKLGLVAPIYKGVLLTQTATQGSPFLQF